MITLEELEKIEESYMKLTNRENFCDAVEHMAVGGREGATQVFDKATKYKGFVVFGYDKDVIKLGAEIRRLNGWPKGYEPEVDNE
jgi:hypothetical protein